MGGRGKIFTFSYKDTPYNAHVNKVKVVVRYWWWRRGIGGNVGDSFYKGGRSDSCSSAMVGVVVVMVAVLVMLVAVLVVV